MPEATVEIISETRRAAHLLQPLRLRLLKELAEPDSATGLARRLDLPRQKINYHLRALEQAGLVDLVEERKKGNCTERLVQATATRYLISPEALGEVGEKGEHPQDRYSVAYLIGVAARAIRELGGLRRKAREAGKRLATLTLETEVSFRSPADRKAFAEELARTVADLTVRYHAPDDPDSRPFRFILGAYPILAKEPSTPTDTESRT